MSEYRYLSMSGCSSIAGVDDAADFAEVNNAMRSVGIAADECDVVWAYCAAMLYLGNISFGNGEKAAVANAEAKERAQALLGTADLNELLIKRSIEVRGETTLIERLYTMVYI